jgi:hypothetical protein
MELTAPAGETLTVKDLLQPVRTATRITRPTRIMCDIARSIKAVLDRTISSTAYCQVLPEIGPFFGPFLAIVAMEGEKV